MESREFRAGVWWMGAIDWNRRLFDSLIPLPEGTTYNSYLVKGSEKTALIDTVDPATSDTLLAQLASVESVDYVVCHHAEQDHSGALPRVLQRYPGATVLATAKCRDMIADHLHIPPERVRSVNDREKIPLGGKTLEFIHTPWVHWPETMVTFLAEDNLLFTCDFFGSHFCTTNLFAHDKPAVYRAAKRYFGEIMMPFRQTIKKNIEKISGCSFSMIAPSHGPIYDEPSFIIDAYKDWIADTPKNLAIVPYISMHGSTQAMVDRLVAALTIRNIPARPFELTTTDLGELAAALVDAATIVIGTPTVIAGPHPTVAAAVILANALRPKAKFASVIGSYGWATRAVETVASMIPNLKVEILAPVLCKGLPKEIDLLALDSLAEAIAARHKKLD